MSSCSKRKSSLKILMITVSLLMFITSAIGSLRGQRRRMFQPSAPIARLTSLTTYTTRAM
uniref:Gp42 n=1 Tax=uncultured marine virus TaxID=186617 RepID=A0A0F7LB77_9VIRU|nr:gp42 [uncultured marine virus]